MHSNISREAARANAERRNGATRSSEAGARTVKNGETNSVVANETVDEPAMDPSAKV